MGRRYSAMFEKLLSRLALSLERWLGARIRPHFNHTPVSQNTMPSICMHDGGIPTPTVSLLICMVLVEKGTEAYDRRSGRYCLISGILHIGYGSYQT